MAIEAITQMWELDHGEVQQIEVFELQNTTLTTALLIPEDDHGVEVLLNLHPLSLDKRNDAHHSYRFLVTSVVNSGDESLFIDHAHGQISVATKDAGK